MGRSSYSAHGRSSGRETACSEMSSRRKIGVVMGLAPSMDGPGLWWDVVGLLSYLYHIPISFVVLYHQSYPGQRIDRSGWSGIYLHWFLIGSVCIYWKHKKRETANAEQVRCLDHIFPYYTNTTFLFLGKAGGGVWLLEFGIVFLMGDQADGSSSCGGPRDSWYRMRYLT